MTTLQPAIETLAEQWLSQDKNPSTRAEIANLLSTKNHSELELRLRTRIAFGTAGLRSRMQAGYSRMNSLTVIQTSQGLASYAASQVTDARDRGLVVGCDARHQSESFARLTASAFAVKGFRIHWLGRVHTPLMPFSVLATGACVGVMVTASHNPKDDNGYKVYWGNGAQILSPRDSEIAESIERNLDPVCWDENRFVSSGLLVKDGRAEIEERYIRAVARESCLLPNEHVPGLHFKDGGIKFTYTPMHGVGLNMVEKVLRYVKVAGDMHVVSSQAVPDPDFPTVRFPNPEEKGALDEAIKVADSHGDNLILANDPDADRFAAAEKVDGVWRQLTGNQVGVLLASFVVECDQRKQKAKNISRAEKQPQESILSTTAVSSRMLFAMAKGRYTTVETLTGFKWLGNKAQEGDSMGKKTLFAYEEALGYMFPSILYDKDGVSAIAVFLGACRWFQEQGLTPWTKLQSLYAEYGYFEEANTYLVSPSAQTTRTVFEDIRSVRPKAVGSRKILRWRDLTVGEDTGAAKGVPDLPIDPSVQMITCEVEENVIFTARGSGTEPKIKLYIEASSFDAATAREKADSVLHHLVAEWFKPEINGLRLA